MQVVQFAAALQVIGVALAGYSQYFYRSPLAAGYYQGDFHQYEPQIFAHPNFYNSIPQVPQYHYQQPIFPAQTFRYQHVAPVSPVRATNVQENENVNAAPSRGNEPQQESTFNFVRKEADNFRGFAYHTEFDHGARSDVVFITGPEVHNIQTQITKQQNPHTTASDSVDSNAVSQQDNESIEQLPMSIEALVNFIRNPEVGVRKFYSIDNALVAQKSEDYLQFPANTIPLATPASPIYNVLRANFNAESKSEEKTEVKEEQVVSASETKSKTVELEVSSTEASTTQAAASSSAKTTSTEAVSSSSTTTEVASTTTTTESVKSTMGTIIVADEEDTPKKT